MFVLISIGCFILVISVLACAAFIYVGKIYRLVPGWGPVTKYDSDASEDLAIRQHIIGEHQKSLRDPPQPAIGLWGKDPGTILSSPIYGSVIAHDGWAVRQQQREADPAAPRDEPYFRDKQNISVAYQNHEAFYGNVSHRVA